jgi:hypothetical protein
VDDRVAWARRLAETAPVRAAQPARICALVVEALDVTGAGIARVTSSGHRGVVAATDDRSALIEDLQLTLGEGPCMDAERTGRPVLVPRLDQPHDVLVDRWPAFTEAAAGAGVQAVFAFPLRIGAISLGAMDLYRDRPGELRPTELRAAVLAADAAALALLHLDPGGPAVSLEEPASYEFQVHQATGMVQVQLGITTEEAFLVLRGHAFAVSLPLAEVASEVVARRLRFDSEAP